VVTVQIVHGTVNVYPVDKNGPKCYGTNNDPITGGLFGIAVALSSGKDSGGMYVYKNGNRSIITKFLLFLCISYSVISILCMLLTLCIK